MTFQSRSGTKKVNSWRIWSVWRKEKRLFWGQKATQMSKSNMTDRCRLIMHRWWRATLAARALMNLDSNSDSLQESTQTSKVTATSSLYCHSISKTSEIIIIFLAVHTALLITSSKIQMQAWAALTLYLKPTYRPIAPITTQALRWWTRWRSSQVQFKATIHSAPHRKEDSLLLEIIIIIWRQICISSSFIMVAETLIMTSLLHHLITNSASTSNQSNNIAIWLKTHPNFKWLHHPQPTVLNKSSILIQVVVWQMH